MTDRASTVAAPRVWHGAARPRDVWAVVITYRRETALGATLRSIAQQTQVPRRVLVVDNGSSAAVREVVEEARLLGLDAVYVDMGHNAGPAGAMARAMELLLSHVSDDAWLLRLDDDHALPHPRFLAGLHRFARSCRTDDPMTAAVGLSGARFDWRSARLRKPSTREGVERVPVDYVATGWFALYRAGAVRAVGSFDPLLFFGGEELEYGLRLRAAGYSLYRWDPPGAVRSPSPSLWRVQGEPGWRDYYSLRNLLVILRRDGHRAGAVHVALLRGLLKPLLNMPLAPRISAARLRINLWAIRDALRGRLGCTWDPAVGLADREELPLT